MKRNDMKKLIWMLLILCGLNKSMAQGSYSVSVNANRSFYCNTSQSVKISGQARSFTATVFTGIKYHFYYYTGGFYQEIGYFSATNTGGSLFTSYGNIQGAYFDGSQIGNAQMVTGGGSNLWINIDVPYSAFPNNNTGQQLAIDIEAIDQYGSTTTHSSKYSFDVPLLYTNPVVLSSTAISANTTILCGSASAQLSGAPNMSSYGFRYDWYRDGAAIQLGDATGTISVSAPGNYYAIVSDVCQTATSNTIAISTGIVPGKPSISSSNGTYLCNGASTTLSASPGAGGTIYWNTGATGNTLTVTAPGNYYCWEVNGCGQGPNSDGVIITTSSSPTAPGISSSNGTLLCNGASTTLSAGGVDGTVTWNNGQTGSSISVAGAGNYYAYQTNACGTGGNSNTINITTGNAPAAPAISASKTLLCNGESATITASGIDGTVTWNTGQTGASLVVSNAGTYYANQTNSCGTSANSNSIVISNGSTPGAPVISTDASLLCNGSTATLTASAVSGTVSWSTGQTGNSIIVSSAGNYFAVQSNSCGTSPASNTITISSGSTAAAPVVSSSNGTFLCNGASTVLSTAPSAGGTIRWSTGASGNTITLTAPGSYYAWEENGCGNSPASNTIVITTGSVPAAPVVSPGYNQLLCNGASATLSSTGSSITWSTGATGNSISVSAAGTYYAYDHNACGNSSYSNQVVIATGNCPMPSPGSSYTICPGKTKTLDAGSGFDSYLWNTGATTQTISAGPGTYSVTVTKNGCSAVSGTITVGYYSVTAPVISAAGSTSFCAGGSVTISSSAASAYLWNTGETGSSILVTASGNFSVTTTDNNGCQAVSNTITTSVNALPGASLSGSTAVCQNGTAPQLIFSGSGGTAPYTFSYRINGGGLQQISSSSGNSVALTVPSTTAGTYTYSLVSVKESGANACVGSASGSATVTVNPLPTASISGTATVCQNAATPIVTLTGAGGTAPYTFSYRINGGSIQSVSSSTANSVSIPVATGTAGTFTYSLVSITDASSTSCSSAASGSATIVVNPLPNASISGSAVVCQNSNAPVLTFSGSGGTAPYTFSYSINGGAAQTLTSSAGGNATLTAPTNSPGTYQYSLLSVLDASSASCSGAANGSAIVQVNPLPAASIAGSTAVCQGSSAPQVVFTGSGGTAPYTFVYTLSNGSNLSISTTAGNSVSLPVSTAVAGDFTYRLISVRDGSSTACANSASGSATISIHALPTATISGETAVCQNTGSPLVQFSGSGGSAPYTFTYRINGGPNQTITTATGNSITLAVPTGVAGSFTYSLISVQDGSSTHCSNSASGTITVTIYPAPEAAVITTPNTHLCNGASGQIKILNYSSGNTYQWYYNNLYLRTSALDTLINDQPGNFQVKVFSPQGCAAASLSNEIKITTGSVPTPVILGANKVCDSGKTLLVIESPAKPYERWRWTDPPDHTGARKLYGWDDHFFAEAGQYQVWVMRDGCADSTVLSVSKGDTAYPAGELQINPSVVPYGGLVTVRAAVSKASSFHWDFGDGNKAITRDSMVQQRYYHPGDSLLVQVDAVSERNCITHFTKWLKVLPPAAITQREPFVQGNLKDWNFFPIPFHHQLKVSVVLKKNQDILIELFSAEGKKIMRWIKTGVQGENLFELEGVERLTPGVLYLVSAVYDNEKHFDKVYKN